MAGIKCKVVVITGASSGIGEATALMLAERGAKVVLGAAGSDRLKAVADRIVEAGGEAAHAKTDMRRCLSSASRASDISSTPLPQQDIRRHRTRRSIPAQSRVLAFLADVPVDDRGRMLTTADSSAQLRRLIERKPEAGGVSLGPERENVEPAIRLV